MAWRRLRRSEGKYEAFAKFAFVQGGPQGLVRLSWCVIFKTSDFFLIFLVTQVGGLSWEGGELKGILSPHDNWAFRLQLLKDG